MKRKWITIVALVVIVAVFIGGYAVGLNIYQKTLDALGFIEITDQCQVVEIEIDDASTLKVTLEPNVTTQVGILYIVHIYLDGVDTAQQVVSWTSGEIASLTKKKVTFYGLALTTATIVKVEVTH